MKNLQLKIYGNEAQIELHDVVLFSLFKNPIQGWEIYYGLSEGKGHADEATDDIYEWFKTLQEGKYNFAGFLQRMAVM